MDTRIAAYTEMKHATPEDYEIVASHLHTYDQGLADRVLALLNQNKGVTHAQKIDNLTHCLQTATRAMRGLEEEEMVVAALLHDVAQPVSTWNHAEVGAGILRPYISADTYWLLKHHAIFQGYYYFHYYGYDRNQRDRYLGHPMFQKTANFCEHYDQASFDPNYETMPLSAFEPMVHRLFARAPALTSQRDRADASRALSQKLAEA